VRPAYKFAPCAEALGTITMEQFIALAFYLALIVVGFYFDIWVYQPDLGFSVLVEGTFLIMFGGYLVWLDFLSPDREKP
jgi:cell division protein FtsW (lipid II flippase)